jgi:hypothetical protein
MPLQRGESAQLRFRAESALWQRRMTFGSLSKSLTRVQILAVFLDFVGYGASHKGIEHNNLT